MDIPQKFKNRTCDPAILLEYIPQKMKTKISTDIYTPKFISDDMETT